MLDTVVDEVVVPLVVDVGDTDDEVLLVTVGETDVVDDCVADTVTVFVLVTLADGLLDSVGVTVGVADGLPIAYRLKSSAPKYRVPSVPMAADDSIGAPMLQDQATDPLDRLRAANVPSKHPTYTTPFAPIAGMVETPAVNP